jgi:hypothetical protein
MGKLIDHPAAALMAEVAAERAVASTPEAEALMGAVCKAIADYWDYLERQGIIYDEERDLMKASALHITYDGIHRLGYHSEGWRN